MAREMHDVSFETHMQELAPFSPSDDLMGKCLEQLRADKKVEKFDDFWRFTEFLDTEIADKNETEAFQPLDAICQSMCKVQRESTTRYRHMGNTQTMPAIGGSTHKVDAVLHLRETRVPDGSDKLYTTDIACNLEYKSGNNSTVVRDNRLKAVSGAVHILNNDPARDFTYSITIEGTDFSIWYWSRSYSTRTIPFDFTKNVELTIKALASFLFASETQLGYNPSIRYRPQKEGGETTHSLVYKVADRFFKTTKTVASHTNLGVTGRGTRVFEVIEVRGLNDVRPVEGALPKVLKHVWLQQQGKTEKEIRDMVFERLKTLQKNEAELKERVRLMVYPEGEEEERERIELEVRNEGYAEYFLTIDCDERGLPSKSLPHSASTNPKLFSKETRPMKPPRMHLSGGVPVPAFLESSSSPTSTQDQRAFAPKTPWFVVYREVCQALHDVGDLHTVIRATRDCFRAIIFLNLVSWVHRDISTGNLLWNPQTGHGILSDLEYAKDMTDTQGSGDPKTGTPLFMATEIALNELLLARKRTVDPFQAAPSLRTVNPFQAAPSLPSEPQPQYSVQHIFPHDSESFLWLVLWILSERLVIGEAEQLLREALDYIGSKYFGANFTASRVVLLGYPKTDVFERPFVNTSMLDLFWAIGQVLTEMNNVYEGAARTMDDNYRLSMLCAVIRRMFVEALKATNYKMRPSSWAQASGKVAPPLWSSSSQRGPLPSSLPQKRNIRKAPDSPSEGRQRKIARKEEDGEGETDASE
ncbi:hypothetical protein C8Q80DRAFT_1266546 [Daedaleopsis nitida]|nr:hypothetical protein C8Q80DRAFT_1266546 [Daedaleopsis nitida]